MSRLKLTKRYIKSQLQNIKYIASRLPVTTPSFGSMTLENDDVEIVYEWLENRSEWDSTEIITQYESKFANWNNSKYAFSFRGGRVALSALIYALGLQPGDEVIIPGYTCIVVPNAFHFAGIEVVYSDIELDTYGLDAAQLKNKITPQTKVILLHHLYGLVSRDYEEIIRFAQENNLFVIEDCAQSTGAEYKGRNVGYLGDVAFYSSENSKVFSTVQGGIATTDDGKIAERIEEFQNNSPVPTEEQIEILLYTSIINYYNLSHPKRRYIGGLINLWYGDKKIQSTTDEEIRSKRPANYGQKMPAPIAAIGLNQLDKIDKFILKRQQTAQKWDHWCDKMSYNQPMIIPESKPVYLRYPVLVEPDKKHDTDWALRDLGVKVGVWYSSNLHPSQSQVTGCPNADIAVKQCINLPTLL